MNKHSIVGASLKGFLPNVTYDLLVAEFGEPNGSGEPGKVQVEWIIDTDDGVVTIYDWKQDVSPRQVTDWNVGGHDRDLAIRVVARIGQQLHV